MVQQMAIYEQGCNLMVSAPFLVRMNRITFLDRMKVRIFSILDDKRLT